MSRRVVASIEGELRRYKGLAEGAVEQIDDVALAVPRPGGGNAIAVVLQHLAGNLASRFTDFLTTDGEKPWRRRDEEFAPGLLTRDELLERWERGWGLLFGALAELTDDDLDREVRIRGVALSVAEALHRALAHVAYHVGQIVQSAREAAGDGWRFLSIPPGGTEEYNRNPTREKAPGPKE
ncbi:MAG: DUF1572 family protein [Thermoanaerobaculia bacterium]|nr:DUF1572 family protein [Thermoanaerobaculia bacterium]